MSWHKAPKEAEACKDFADRALNRITELEAEIERLRPDAERYRKAKQDPDFDLSRNYDTGWGVLDASEWDDELDAAREGE